jgi:L-2,4-diaminobutyrate decarboxylase
MIPPEIASDLTAGHAFVDLVEEYLRDARSREVPAPVPPAIADVVATFDEPAPRRGRPLDEVLDDVRRRVLPNATWTPDPMHMGHQLSVPLPAAIWAETIVAALNPSHAVAELSGATTVIERRIVRWLADLARLGPDAGGTFAIGATECTFSGLAAARARALPHAWEQGLRGGEAVVMVSEHAHYSVARAVSLLGLGAANAIRVPSDERFAMDPAALERLLDAETRTVVAVVATSGSTAVGAFDDLTAIGRICAERGVWLHVDGAHGASALLSETHRHRMAGVEQVRSLAWDPHKMMSMPIANSALLMADEGDLDAAFAQSAPYLFHDRAARPIDQGVRSFQCSRRGDALKLWVAWHRYGTEGFAAVYDHLCATTHAIWERVSEHPAFEPVNEPECNILCFRHVGDDDLNARLRPAYNASGEGWITLTRLGERPVLRITVMNPLTTAEDGSRMLDGVARLAGTA